MTKEQLATIDDVYAQFMKGEEHAGWDLMDDQLCHLEYLDDHQTIIEVKVQLERHGSTVACNQEFCNQGCYAQIVVEAVKYIVNDCECEILSVKERYVLDYYLSLSQLGMIVKI